jgi:hypothetical protein
LRTFEEIFPMSQSHRTPRIDPRWIRHDAHLWIRPDIARFMLPGVDPADVIPALAEKRAQEQAARERARAAEDAAFDAWIEGERRLLAAMRDELNEIKAELARRRRLAEQTKYSPDQPRIPKQNPVAGNGPASVEAAVSRLRRTSRNRWAMPMSATSAAQANSLDCSTSRRMGWVRIPRTLRTAS